MAEMRLMDFMNKVTEDSFGKKDYEVKASKLRMDERGRLVGYTNEGRFSLGLNEWGRNQALWRTGAEGFAKYGSYLNEIEESKKLSELFNFHMESLVKSKGDRDWLVRAKGNMARAILSSRYSILDNDFIAERIFDQFKDSDVSVVGNSISDVYMNVRIKLNDMTVNAGSILNNDPLSVGIHVINSEVGASSIVVYPVIYRQVCSNGLVVEYGRGNVYRQRHLITPEVGEDRIAAKVDEAISAGNEAMEEFLKTRDIRIKEPREVIADLAKREKYSNKLIEKVIESFEEDPDDSKYGVINAFTRAARDFEYERRIEIERFAGSLLIRKVA